MTIDYGAALNGMMARASAMRQTAFDLVFGTNRKPLDAPEASHGEGLDKATVAQEQPAPKRQYAALCFRRKGKARDLQVLLVTSRDTGRWVLPKGWPIDGKRGHETAATEAMEEAGASGTVNEKPLGHYPYEKILDDGAAVACEVEVYALAVKQMKKNYKEKSQRQLKWFRPEKAAGQVHEAALQDLLHAFAKQNG